MSELVTNPEPHCHAEFVASIEQPLRRAVTGWLLERMFQLGMSPTVSSYYNRVQLWASSSDYYLSVYDAEVILSYAQYYGGLRTIMAVYDMAQPDLFTVLDKVLHEYYVCGRGAAGR